MEVQATWPKTSEHRRDRPKSDSGRIRDDRFLVGWIPAPPSSRASQEPLRMQEPWQNGAMSHEAGGTPLATQITSDLLACRKRGIDRLDIHTHNQEPVPAMVLTRLASDYSSAQRLMLSGRVAQIKRMMRETLEAFRQENELNELDEALVRDLFFGDAQHRVIKTAGQLLDDAMRKHGETDKARFRLRWSAAIFSFAEYLSQFVSAAIDPPIEPGLVAEPPRLEPEVKVQPVGVRVDYVRDGERFISLLAQADSVTIVGLTIETLANMLEEALARKRVRSHRPDALWDDLRVVFLDDDLLGLINDERSESPDVAVAMRLRQQAAGYGRRSVSVFLRRMVPGRWSMYKSSHLPSHIGTFFEMPDGSQVVQQMIRHPERTSHDHLFVELELFGSMRNYFSSLFETIVRNSNLYREVVPFGRPAGREFHCVGERYLDSVLKDGSGATDWLPVVLIVTWRVRNGSAEPLLQLRTVANAARELNRFSHLSGHIYEEDYNLEAANAVKGRTIQRIAPPFELGLRDDVPMRTARRRVEMETGEKTLEEFEPVVTHSYLHPDKEHLYFFVYGCEFRSDFQPPRHAEMHPVPLLELLALRENQVLLKAEELRRASSVPARVRPLAWEIIGLNLQLHGHTELGGRLTDCGGRPPAAAFEELGLLAEQTRQTSVVSGRELQLMGLSGLQYREFFTLLLPLYARVDVADAARQLEQINANQAKREAVTRLAALYQDEGLMRSIPVEL
jgi:hypothetical protein